MSSGRRVGQCRRATRQAGFGTNPDEFAILIAGSWFSFGRRIARGSRMPRIGILVVAYNAESTLRSVLHRIPEPIVEKIDEIFVFDDASADNTTEVAKACKEELPHAKLSVFKNPVNLMYGGNQSKGY